MPSRNIHDLAPPVAAMARCFVKAAEDKGLDVLITCTLRTKTEQAALYAQGRTRPGPGATKARPLGQVVTWAEPGESAHNYGYAFDFVPMYGGKPVWSDKSPLWQQLGEIGEACGLEWGGRWPSKRIDRPHLQLKNWRARIAKQEAA